MSTNEEHHYWPPSEPKIVKKELISSISMGGNSLKKAIWVLSILSILGLVGLLGKLFLESDDQTQWGYIAATLAFILSTTGGAPMVAVAPLIAKANWARPISRIAHIIGAVSIINIIIMIPILWVLPPLIVDDVRRRSIWFEAPNYSPHFWDTLGLIMLAIVGLALLYSSALPDFAVIRDNSSGYKQRISKILARGFVGTTVQWSSLRMRLSLINI